MGLAETVFWPAVVLILGVAAQRLAELRLSRRHAEDLLAQGAEEVGAGHYPIIVVIHLGFISGLLVESMLLGARPPAWWALPLALFVAAQALRYWAMSALGRRWTTRIFVLPGASLVTAGPYRYLRHPNYTAVLLEFITLPLILGAYWTGAIFLPLKAAVLYGVRIPCEEAALQNLEAAQPEAPPGAASKSSAAQPHERR